MDKLAELIGYIETHSVEGMRECFAAGIDPNQHFNNEPLLYELTSEYARGPRFKECVKVFVEAGLDMDDKALQAVLLDDAAVLDDLLKGHPEIISKKYTLRCAYTPLYGVTLLHICAEFNHVACAGVLVKHGAGIDAPAGLDEYGFGGQTPVFHTVNQNNNHSVDMLHFLLSKEAATRITLQGLIWGKSYPWETLIPAVNPISYAMMGLLPQMHRDEKTITETVTILLNYTFGVSYTPSNIPNAYLK